MPGVLAVFTGADLAGDKIGNLICGWMIHSKDGSPMKMAAHPALANGKACHVGDPVAVVIAETLAQARDAAEKVKVDYGVLPAVADPAAAQKPGAPQIHDIAPNNTIYQWISATPKRSRRRSRRPSTSPGSTSSTTGWCRMRSSRARRSAITIPAAAPLRCGTPRRIRTSRGWSSPLSSAWRRSTNCASLRPMSAAASARRFSSIPRKSWPCGRQNASAGR